jgi:hypothetical protein
MKNVKFWKGELTLVVTERDYQEYVEFMEGNINKTRIGDLLHYDMADYEDIMGTYAQINQ